MCSYVICPEHIQSNVYMLEYTDASMFVIENSLKQY